MTARTRTASLAWRWLYSLLLSALLVCCQGLLGIEDRQLDDEPLSAKGYSGCEPARGRCDACTSAWHSCVCEGWDTKPEARLRLECAEEAPRSIRDEVLQKAERAYDDYLAELDGGVLDAAGADRDSDDDEAGSDDPGTPGAASEAGMGDREDPEAPGEPDSSVTDEPRMDSGPPLPDLPNFNDELCSDSPDACEECICEQCQSDLGECQDDIGCSIIMNCIVTQTCDPLLTTGPNSCYGPDYCKEEIDDNGGTDGRAYELMQDLLLCTINSGCPCGDAPGGACSPEGDCRCTSCWAQCACEEDGAARCRDKCGDPDCKMDTGCTECGDCVDTCLCSGQNLPYCIDFCRPGDHCSSDEGCLCGDCYSDCACEGNGPGLCDARCAPDQCTPSEGCFCEDCVSTCVCDGNPEPYCQQVCDDDFCTPLEGCYCDDCVSTCMCYGANRQTCEADCQPEACSPAGGCSCESCYDACFCNGFDSFECDDQCACTQDGGCNCGSCFDDCSCLGYDATTCDAMCACTREGGCNCGDCFSDCVCEGFDDATCDQQCAGDLCSADQGCYCDDCFAECECYGMDATSCQDYCSCSYEGGCNCGDCFSDCYCLGYDDTFCTAQCGGDDCSPEANCACGNCYDDCLCQGNDIATCDGYCAGSEFPDCAPWDYCEGCVTCMGDCMCDTNQQFSTCVQDCGLLGCNAAGGGDCSTCKSCQARCECNNGEPNGCYQDCSYQPCAERFEQGCSLCACESCPSEFGMCEEIPGCLALVDCMTQFDCGNVRECFQPAYCEAQIVALGGLGSETMDLAEGLYRCRSASACGCDAGSEPPIDWTLATGSYVAYGEIAAVGGSLYEVDVGNGSVTLLANVPTRLGGLTFDPGRQRLLGLTDDDPNLLVEVHLDGSLTQVGSTGYPDLAGLAYEQSSRRLYAVRSRAANVELIRIDPANGVSTYVGTTALAPDNGVGNLALGPGGQLHLFNQGVLYQIDALDAAATPLAGFADQLVAGLQYDASSSSWFGVTSATAQGQIFNLTLQQWTNLGTPQTVVFGAIAKVPPLP